MRKPTKKSSVPPNEGTAPLAKSMVGHSVAKVRAMAMLVSCACGQQEGGVAVCRGQHCKGEGNGNAGELRLWGSNTEGERRGRVSNGGVDAMSVQGM